MKNKIKVILLLILLLSVFLRIFKLDTIPPSLNWDEINAGYNAYAIANWGRDEWGQTLPLVFTSFRDDKHPVHIYLTAPFVRLFGLSDFVTRLPSAIVGILSVLLIYLISYSIFRSYLVAILSALFLAISPYHIHFSRGLWESNFALFFFLLGLMLFYKALENKGRLIILSFLSFGISLFAYHSSKVVVLPLVVLLTILYFRNLKKLSWNFYIALVVFLFFVILLVLNPRLTGLARVKQTQFSQTEIEKTQLFKKTGNYLLGHGELTLNGVLLHFTPEYLFIKGDQSPRNSVKVFGEFYQIDALFIPIGILSLIILRSRVTLVIFAWLLLSPLPASLVVGAPNANRGLFMLACMTLIASYGAGSLIKLFRGRFKVAALTLVLIVLSLQAFSYIQYYFNTYPKKDPHDWVYGMKQVVEYIRENDDNYDQVYMTDVRSQPYTFFLYYLETPLPDFAERVFYNTLESKSYNTVSNFDKYYFGGWDTVESMPQQRVVYILSTSQYDGLRHKVEFDIKKVVKFPDGSDAFFIVSAK